jgi:glycosyltransferase involved in cell wall biosynthesis
VQHEFFLYGGPTAVPALPLALGALRAAGAGPVVTMHHAVDPAAIDADFMRLHRVRAPAGVGRAGLGSVQQAIRRLARRVIVHEPLFARWVPGSSVIPHGLEPAPAGALGAAEARASLGLDDRFTALCLGFIAPYKGLEVALEAAALEPESLQLVVAGADHPRLAEADPYAQRLRRKWSGAARFTGHVPEQKLAALFAAADVALFLYPTVFSSSGALALALAHRTPVLLSPALAGSIAAPATLEVALDPNALAARLRELIGEPTTSATHARDSTALTRDRSWAGVARRHLRVYEEVSHASRASRRLIRAA